MRKIKWGVMGTASIARGFTIPGMKLAENCELYAIAGRSPEKAEQFRKEFGFLKAYGSYEELLQDPEVEAVYIPLPNELHCEWAKKAMEAKKHVLCEKPLAPSAEQAEDLINAAKENGVFLMEAFAYLHSPLIRALKEELDSKVIGDVLYLENAFITSDYDVSNIRMRRETFGGAAYDLGCYCTSQFVWLLGEPERVSAVADFSRQQVDRLTTGIAFYESGARAVFTCGMVLPTEQYKRLDRLQIHGTKGVIRTDAEFNQAGTLTYTVTAGGQCVEKTVQARQNYSLEIEQFGRCLAGDETPHVSGEFTLANARTLDKVLASIGYSP